MSALLTPRRRTEILKGMGHSRVVILGDVMLDRYISGAVHRISPEAPVPILEVKSEAEALGGAANVAANIVALGDTAEVVGVTGNDANAERLRAAMREAGISSDYLVSDPTRCTTLKTRVLADTQQIVRIDREDRHEINSATEEKIVARITDLCQNAAALIISDYGKGAITKSLLEKIIPPLITRGVFVAVDPKETHFLNYRTVSLITPNHHEASFAAGKKILGEGDLRSVGEALMSRLSLGALLITRGKDGMALFERSDPNGITMTLAPTFARRVFDVTGAGDTVIASFVSAICAGATLTEATVISNAAAGVVVGEIGAATVSLSRLEQELSSIRIVSGETE